MSSELFSLLFGVALVSYFLWGVTRDISWDSVKRRLSDEGNEDHDQLEAQKSLTDVVKEWADLQGFQWNVCHVTAQHVGQNLTLTFRVDVHHHPLFSLQYNARQTPDSLRFSAPESPDVRWTLDYWFSLLVEDTSLQDVRTLRMHLHTLRESSRIELDIANFNGTDMVLSFKVHPDAYVPHRLILLLNEIKPILLLIHSLEWLTRADQIEHRLHREVMTRKDSLPGHDPLGIKLLTSFTMSPHQRRQILQKLDVSEDTYPLMSPQDRFLAHPILQEDLLNDAPAKELHPIYHGLKSNPQTSGRVLKLLLHRERDLGRMLSPSYQLHPEHVALVKMHWLSRTDQAAFSRFIHEELAQIGSYHTRLYGLTHQLLSLSGDMWSDDAFRATVIELLDHARRSHIQILERCLLDASLEGEGHDILRDYLLALCRDGDAFKALDIKTRHALFLAYEPHMFSHIFFLELLRNTAFEQTPSLVERYKALLDAPKDLVVLESLDPHRMIFEFQSPETVYEVHRRFASLAMTLPTTELDLCQRLDTIARSLLHHRNLPSLEQEQACDLLAESIHAYTTHAIRDPARRGEVLTTLGQLHEQARLPHYKKFYLAAHQKLLENLGMSTSQGALSVAVDGTMQGALSES